MIGLTERKLSLSDRTALFFLWVILLCSLLTLFLSIHNENTSTIRSRSSHSIGPHPQPPTRPRYSERRSFITRSAHHSPSSRPTHEAQLSETRPSTAVNGDSETIYEGDKRVIHTGPNPLHN